METGDLRVELTAADVLAARHAVQRAIQRRAPYARLVQLVGDVQRLVEAYTQQVEEDVQAARQR